MKLSVMTYRASSERLNLLRQSSYGTSALNPTRRGSSLDSWMLSNTAASNRQAVYRKSYSDRLTSPPPPRRARVVSFDVSDDDDYDDDQYFNDDADDEDSVECVGGGMMVDGSPRRIPPQAETDSNSQQQQNEKKPSDTEASSGAPAVSAPADSSSSAPPQATGAPSTVAPSAGSGTSRSRWMKLRTTVQLSGAITQVHKKPPLKREDSFLKRFSTRQIPDPNAIDSSRRGADGMIKGPFFGTWRSVVNPDENILFYWLSLLTVCLLYNAWTIIARQAFPELQKNIIWYILDSFTDVVFLLDIAFQFRTGYLEQGLMVCESKKLAGHYIRSKCFLMDIFAITPLDLVQLKVGIIPIVRFPRFLKVYRSFRFYYMVESRTIYPNLWRVVNLIHILLLLAHWFGCFYYMLSELEGFVGEWSYRQPIGDYATLSRKYLGSVYWSTLTLTTIGDLATPATNLQYLFTIVSYLIGVFIFATIVGQVGNVITNRNASRLEFERLLDGAKLYMRHHKVPRNMQRRVQRWYDYSWSRGRMQGGGDINSALGILPDKLKTELALHVNLKTLKKVSIFQECQPEFLHDLVLKMKAYIFTPGDLICRKGEVAREMFIIADGILEVISETGKVLTQMKAGDFFGEIGILNLDGFNRRTADVRSVGYSELFSLSREDILAAMKDYPEAQEILQTMGRKRLMEARLAANVGKTGANASETIVPSNKKILGDGSRKGQPKPRTAVSKLKDDVRSLKKLLRTRSTPPGKYTEADEQVEMKLIQPSRQDESSSTGPESTQSTSRRRNASIKKLMRKIHLRGDEGSSNNKGLTECLSSIRSRPERSGVAESPSGSTESSADSSTPLNKALPLLQRVRMLGEQERKAAANRSTSPTSPKHIANPPTEVIGEGLPLLERLKLLKAREQAQTSAATAADSSKLMPKEEMQKPSLSPKSKNNPLSSLITSAKSPGSTSPKLVPKKENLSLKGRVPEYSGEIPLLKKVLLMKIMEDKKPDASTESETNKEEKSVSEIAKEETEQKTENNSNTSDLDSEKVYLEQFSRTLGFQMSQLSEDIPPAAMKPQPRPRLNALSRTPSPSKENVSIPDILQQQKSEPIVKKEVKKKTAQTQVRKGRLSRMMAVREDSDENSDDRDDEDPFVKSTEVQTDDEDHGKIVQPKTASNETLIARDSLTKGTKLDDGIQEYLVKVMNNMKCAMKAYVVEQQQELQKRIIELESDIRKKDEVIKSLKLQLKQQTTRASSTFDEVSSIDPSSLSVSDADDNDSEGVNVEGGAGREEQEDDEDRDLDDEEIRALQEKLKKQRKSWPTSITIGRRKLRNSNKSYSLDEDQQPVDATNSDELWKLEFPQTPTDKMSSTLPQIIATIPERLVEESSLPESEEDDQVGDRLLSEASQPKVTATDWEVQMLVQQFEKNVRQRRRHSSGEALTWDKVLHLRNVALIGDQGSESGRSNYRHHRRKYSLVEEGTLQQWAGSSMVQSSSHTSLTEAKGSQRTMLKSPRRKSYGQQKHFEPPSTRKNSMPILPHCSSIGMSRWLSLDDAKSEGCRSQDSSLHTTLSSAYSQETVIGVESRFASIDDVRRESATGLGMRSPSSPNVVTDRDCTTSFEYAATSGSNLPEWPSSPCLPTISEDEQSHSVFAPSSTSTGRSASLSTLPLGNKPSESSHNAHSLQNFKTFTGTTCRRRSSVDSGSRDQARSSSTPDNLCLVNNIRASNTSTIFTRGTTNNNIMDSPPQSPEPSVVILIPEHEPLLSP